MNHDGLRMEKILRDAGYDLTQAKGIRLPPEVRREAVDMKQALITFLKVFKIEGWEPEYKFCESRRWRFDVAFPAIQLGIEIDGGHYVPGGGKHTSLEGFENDCEKLNEAILLGWRILRFSPRMVTQGIAINFIERALENG